MRFKKFGFVLLRFFDGKHYSHVKSDGGDGNDSFGIQGTIKCKRIQYSGLTRQDYRAPLLSNHGLQLHDDTPLNQQGQRKADRKTERQKLVLSPN